MTKPLSVGQVSLAPLQLLSASSGLLPSLDIDRSIADPQIHTSLSEATSRRRSLRVRSHPTQGRPVDGRRPYTQVRRRRRPLLALSETAGCFAFNFDSSTS